MTYKLFKEKNSQMLGKIWQLFYSTRQRCSAFQDGFPIETAGGILGECITEAGIGPDSSDLHTFTILSGRSLNIMNAQDNHLQRLSSALAMFQIQCQK